MLSALFDSPTLYILCFLLSFGGSLLLGPRLIRVLTAMKAGQPIREASKGVLAPEHQGKVGTPTMGGVMIIGLIFLTTILFADLTKVAVQCCLFIMLVTAGLGFMDDYAKISKKTTDGVSAKTKLAIQAGSALIASLYFYYCGNDAGILIIPFYDIIDIGWLIIPLGVLVIVGTSNAVNLTDGLDGLASGCMIAASAALIFLGAYCGLSVMMLAIAGACMGFLWFNCNPAKVFMGDTGSLSLGGILGTAALCCNCSIVLVLIGAVFVWEAMSVMIQVAWFKYTRKKTGEGQRFFRMAPFHHHLEQCGWKETQISVRLWIISLICAVLGVLGVIYATANMLSK